MSYVFYGWWNPWFILLMFFVTVVNYVCGRFMSRPGATTASDRLGAITAGRGQPGHARLFSSTSPFFKQT